MVVQWVFEITLLRGDLQLWHVQYTFDHDLYKNINILGLIFVSLCPSFVSDDRVEMVLGVSDKKNKNQTKNISLVI